MLKEIENDLVDLLRQVREVLDEHNIEFWLDCGTLLGAVRDGIFIPWEHDIDLGLWHEKVSKTVKTSVSKTLCDRGFKVWIAENHMTIKKGEAFWADINFYRLSDGKAMLPRYDPINLIGKVLALFLKVLSVPYYYGIDFSTKPSIFVRSILIIISRVTPSLLRKRLAKILSVIYVKSCCRDVSWKIPSEYFMNLLTITFYGKKFKVPAKTQEYIAYRYGKDWRIARKDWVTERDDGAVSISHHK